MKKGFVLYFFLLYFVFAAQAQAEPASDSLSYDKLKENKVEPSKNFQLVETFFDSLISFSEDGTQLQYTPNELMIKAAFYLLDTPYASQTLEVNKEEQLVVNLQQVDCMTFVENCLAFCRAFQHLVPDYDYFIRELKYIRYRNGIIQGYTSRLHYATDWITDNVIKGTIDDITYAAGGKKFYPDVHYISQHPQSYPALNRNPSDIEAMASIEKKINERSTYYYIPKAEISEKQTYIKDGDIICFTTNISGLDITHVGIAFWNKGHLSFIHASSKSKKVIVNPESLSDYCNMIKNNTGIIILRPLTLVDNNS